MNRLSHLFFKSLFARRADYAAFSCVTLILLEGQIRALHGDCQPAACAGWPALGTVISILLMGVVTLGVTWWRLQDLNWPRWWSAPIFAVSFCGTSLLVFLGDAGFRVCSVVYLLPQLPLVLGTRRELTGAR
jgi:hypothetical protein